MRSPISAAPKATAWTCAQYVESWNAGGMSFIGQAAYPGGAREIGYRRAGNMVIVAGNTNGEGRVGFS